MTTRTLIRLVVDLILAVSVIEGWWFLALPISLIGVWSFPYFAEIIVAGFAYDALYGMVPGMGVKAYAGTIAACISSAIFAGLKKVVRK